LKVKLSKYLKPYALFAVLTPLSMVGEVLGDLPQPKLMSKIVDDGVLGQDMDLIIRTGLLMLLVLIGGGACGIAASAFGGIASQSFQEICVWTFSSVSWVFHLNRPTSSQQAHW